MGTLVLTRTGERKAKYVLWQQDVTVEVLPSCTTGWVTTSRGTTTFTVAHDGTVTYDLPEAVHSLMHHTLLRRCLGAYKYYGHTNTQLLTRIQSIH